MTFEELQTSITVQYIVRAIVETSIIRVSTLNMYGRNFVVFKEHIYILLNRN